MNKLTRFPMEVDAPTLMLYDLSKIRDKALADADFDTALLLSHVYAWIYWLSNNKEELKKLEQ